MACTRDGRDQANISLTASDCKLIFLNSHIRMDLHMYQSWQFYLLDRLLLWTLLPILVLRVLQAHHEHIWRWVLISQRANTSPFLLCWCLAVCLSLKIRRTQVDLYFASICIVYDLCCLTSNMDILCYLSDYLHGIKDCASQRYDEVRYGKYMNMLRALVINTKKIHLTCLEIFYPLPVTRFLFIQAINVTRMNNDGEDPGLRIDGEAGGETVIHRTGTRISLTCRVVTKVRKHLIKLSG